MQVSAAVGAFMLGIAISGATAHNATRILEPLRDLFAAIFFVVFGLNTDPATIPPVLGWALLLAIVTAATKMLTGIWAAKRAGIGVPGRFRAGAALIARGEFSIVIAGLAVASGVVPAELAAMATAYVLIMAVTGPLAAKYVEPIVAMLRRPAKPPAVRTADQASDRAASAQRPARHGRCARCPCGGSSGGCGWPSGRAGPGSGCRTRRSRRGARRPR